MLSTRSDNFWLRIIYIISVLVSASVAFLILGPRPDGIEGTLDVTTLPKLNAILNGLTGIFLLVGYVLIINKKRQAHKNAMLLSFASSTAFLISYIIYHWFKSGPKEYLGDLHIFYYFILISHIVLAAIIIPLALLTMYHGWNDHIGKHRKIAKITLPLWLYVSVTGVIIYYMLYW